jgi:3'-phosphoadenosine 5'-phosphosulfate (PAPS) 3'-phosphatase
MTAEVMRSYEREVVVAAHAARLAGQAIMEFYDRDSAASYTKRDGSLVTDADLASDKIIRQVLTDSFPDDAVLTEEGIDDGRRLAAERVWIADPLDGTNQFIDRTGEFEVFVALVVGDEPVAGVIYHPASGLLLSASAGGGAWIDRAGHHHPLRFEAVPPDRSPRLMTSVWFGAPDNLPILERVSSLLGGGPATVSTTGVTIRRLLPPDHPADALVGYRTGESGHEMGWEWDFAAPDIIVHEAGGIMTDLRGERHRYNKPHLRNRDGIVVSVDPSTHRRIVESIRVETAS